MFKIMKLSTVQSNYGIDVIRILSGLIILSFGLEIFNIEKMNGYTEWTTDVGIPFSDILVHIGKVSELIGGLCLTIGLWTRLASIPLIFTMFVITFIMLDGSIKTGSFYLLMIFVIYFFIGSGRLSLDYLLSKKKE